MSSSSDYKSLEKRSAINFRNALKVTKVKHVIYLSGIVNEAELSKHLSSRKDVELELDKGSYKLTTLRAGIIIGSGIEPLSYSESLEKAFTKIENNAILSSWKDSYSSSGINFEISEFIEVPTFGCFIDKRTSKIDNRNVCLDKIWSIGRTTGWYSVLPFHGIIFSGILKRISQHNVS